MQVVAEYRITLRTGERARREDVAAALAALAEDGAARRVRALAVYLAAVAREHVGIDLEVYVEPPHPQEGGP